MNSPVIVSSVYFKIMVVPVWVWILLWQLCDDWLSATQNPMATGSGSQHQVSFREMFHYDGNLLSSHMRILGETKILINPKNHAPRDWVIAGIRFRGVTITLHVSHVSVHVYTPCCVAHLRFWLCTCLCLSLVHAYAYIYVNPWYAFTLYFFSWHHLASTLTQSDPVGCGFIYFHRPL